MKLSKLIFCHLDYCLHFQEKLRATLIFSLWLLIWVPDSVLPGCNYILVVLDVGSGVFWCIRQTRRCRFLTRSSHLHNKEPLKILPLMFCCPWQLQSETSCINGNANHLQWQHSVLNSWFLNICFEFASNPKKQIYKNLVSFQLSVGLVSYSEKVSNLEHD